MESSAFPGKIKINFMQLKIYKLMNIFMFPKIMQKCCKQYYFLSLETLGNGIFPF